MPSSTYRRIALGAAILTAAVVPVLLTSNASAAVTDGASASRPPANDAAARGMVLRDLRKAERGPCVGGYDVVGHPGMCTPGPDAAPEGVDVRAPKNGGGTGTGGGGKKGPTASPSPSPTPTSSPLPAQGRCGTDGARVQAVYAVASDVPDAYDSLLPSLRQWAAVADDVYARSAAETGGVRRIRYVTDAACVPTVVKVVMTPTGDDSFSNTITELRAAGLDRLDRKYMVWVDSTVYCGIGNVKGDDRAGAVNTNNTGPSYGRTDRGCWGGYTEAHELMHNLGGVQLSAPHSTGAWHCTDEYDRMCYRENGAVMTYPCDQAHDVVFDCGHDDYFTTAPQTGTYLGDHWNAADSVFLSTA
ncbi:MAG TPA: hypothetical protein VNQ77_11915 [Frankiaceae bacterium]|nr:hypothetical protein [Frankiaceae bacterium]